MMQPVTIVTGMGRCGSSLVMAMLAAGGMPVLGNAPDYEDDACGARDIPAELLEANRGRAVKILAAHHHTFPPVMDARIITLRRDATQQARSQMKLLWHMNRGPAPNRAGVRAVATSIVSDEARCDRIWLLTRLPWMALRFEHILAHPLGAAMQLATFCGLSVDAVPAMAAVVLMRGPECLPDMSIEAAGIVKAQVQ